MTPDSCAGCEPDPALAAALEQDEFWTDRYGDSHPLAAMDLGYLRNALGFLHHEAHHIWTVTVPAELRDTVPTLWWLVSRPLTKALVEEIASRGAAQR